MAETTPSASSLIIGEGVTFVGTITAPGRATVNGIVSGEITVHDLHIGAQGSVSVALTPTPLMSMAFWLSMLFAISTS